MTTTTVTPAMLRALRFLRWSAYLKEPGIIFQPADFIPLEYLPALQALERAGLLARWRTPGVPGREPSYALQILEGTYEPLQDAYHDPSRCSECFQPFGDRDGCTTCRQQTSAD